MTAASLRAVKQPAPTGPCHAHRCACLTYTAAGMAGIWPTCVCGHTDHIHRPDEEMLFRGSDPPRGPEANGAA